MISIVIPAHNEVSVIRRCLSALTGGAREGELEVIVACNGCTDGTADAARAFGPPVRVVETQRASKIAALNLGDEHAGGFPRFYLDADIDLTPTDVRAVAAALGEGGALAAAPKAVVDYSGSSWWVRAFYEIWLRLPYHREGMIGSGVYALSEAGRARFGAFPEIIADDGYVRSLFAPGERVTVESCTFTIRAPLTLGGLIKVKTRSRLGLMELRRRFPEQAGTDRKRWGPSLARIARTPRLWPCAVAYAGVVLITRSRARKQLANLSEYRWERDESSRSG